MNNNNNNNHFTLGTARLSSAKGFSRRGFLPQLLGGFVLTADFRPPLSQPSRPISSRQNIYMEVRATDATTKAEEHRRLKIKKTGTGK